MIPPLPERQVLNDSCQQEAARLGLSPAIVEKDFYLTRLLWALAEECGATLLLKGGTCLSKCDLGYHRMSEDADFVIPWAGTTRHKGANAGQTNQVRDALVRIAPAVGVTLESPDGQRSERASHVLWTVTYSSDLTVGRGANVVEVSMRSLLRPPRRATLHCLLKGAIAESYASAYVWALAYDEVRAEKVRAAFTRAEPEIRDFYDLALLANFRADMATPAFIHLVDLKLAEVGAVPLAEQPGQFGFTPAQLNRLRADVPRRLAPMLRRTDLSFDLDAVLHYYNVLWGKVRS